MIICKSLNVSVRCEALQACCRLLTPCEHFRRRLISKSKLQSIVNMIIIVILYVDQLIMLGVVPSATRSDSFKLPQKFPAKRATRLPTHTQPTSHGEPTTQRGASRKDIFRTTARGHARRHCNGAFPGRSTSARANGRRASNKSSATSTS